MLYYFIIKAKNSLQPIFANHSHYFINWCLTPQYQKLLGYWFAHHLDVILHSFVVKIQACYAVLVFGLSRLCSTG